MYRKKTLLNALYGILGDTTYSYFYHNVKHFVVKDRIFFGIELFSSSVGNHYLRQFQKWGMIKKYSGRQLKQEGIDFGYPAERLKEMEIYETIDSDGLEFLKENLKRETLDLVSIPHPRQLRLSI